MNPDDKTKTRQTSSRNRKERVERGDHRLATLETISLQIRKLELEELIEHLALREEPVNALLLNNSWKGRRTTTAAAAAAARFQNVREPETLGFGGRMHVFVRNAPYIDRPEVVCDVAQGPELGLVGCFANVLRP
jgi:hypothetical protein